MTLMLYAHPFSSYCQKVLIALYERWMGQIARLSQMSHARLARLYCGEANPARFRVRPKVSFWSFGQSARDQQRTSLAGAARSLATRVKSGSMRLSSVTPPLVGSGRFVAGGGTDPLDLSRYATGDVAAAAARSTSPSRAAAANDGGVAGTPS